MFDENIGALSEKYESRGDPGIIGWDSTGGWSYGKYQLAANTGSLNEFHNWLKNKYPELESQLYAAGGPAGGRAGSAAYKEAWSLVMGTDEGGEVQSQYAGLKYYVPGAKRILNGSGINLALRSITVRQAAFSTTIQHGAGGASKVFRNALAGLGFTSTDITATVPTDAALIRALYSERRAEHGGKYFPSSSEGIRNSVVNRFHNEEADAIRSLNEEILIAQATPPTSDPTDNSAGTNTVAPHRSAV